MDSGFLIGVIGNLLPCPSDLLFARHILTWGKNHLSEAFLAGVSTRAIGAGQKLEKPQETRESSGPYCSCGNPSSGNWCLTGAPCSFYPDWDFNAVASQSCSGVILAGLIMGTLSPFVGIDTFRTLLQKTCFKPHNPESRGL